jgi:dihydrofolate synthase / folylpolyglutamate synthase
LNLADFLDAKGVEYAPFDPNRFKNFYIKHEGAIGKLPKIVQIVGTNGKGTTGRFLAWMLKNEGFMVAHFTSPHIQKINERFWFDGVDLSDDELENAHLALCTLFADELAGLSYFEYLSLLCVFVFKDKADFLVLEAGVGGEFDSTSVFAKELLLVTKIGFDHTDMLGSTLEEITRTKLKASNCDTIVGFQGYKTVFELIKNEFDKSNISLLSDLIGYDEIESIKKYTLVNNWPSYLADNLALAFAGARVLLDKAPLLKDIYPIEGRFQSIAKNVTVDVGHNKDAASAISKELGNKKVVLVFNCYDDKDAEGVLLELRDNIKRVEIINIDSKRAIKKAKLTKILDRIAVPYANFEKIVANEEYLVFGSFSVVSEFLRKSA